MQEIILIGAAIYLTFIAGAFLIIEHRISKMQKSLDALVAYFHQGPP